MPQAKKTGNIKAFYLAGSAGYSKDMRRNLPKEVMAIACVVAQAETAYMRFRVHEFACSLIFPQRLHKNDRFHRSNFRR